MDKTSLINWLQIKITPKEYIMYYILEIHEKLERKLSQHKLKFNKIYPVILIKICLFVYCNSDNIADNKLTIINKKGSTFNPNITEQDVIDIFNHKYNSIFIDFLLELKNDYESRGLPLLNTLTKNCLNDFIELILYNIDLNDVINS